MPGNKKKQSQALSTFSSGTVIADSCSTHPPCKCQEETQALRDLVGQWVSQTHSNTTRTNELIADVTKGMQQIVSYLKKINPAFPNPPEVIPCSAASDVKECLTELKEKTQARLALVEGSISQLRLKIADKLQTKEASISPYTPNPTTDNLICPKLISTVGVGLRILNKRIRKNNIVIHGLDPSKQNCTEQVDTFFQTHLKMKLPIQQAYRLGSSYTEKSAPILVVFPSLHYKLELFKNCKLLSGTPFSIQDDLSPEERRERSRKLEVFKSYKPHKKKAVFRGSDLYVDGELIPC